MRHFKLGGEPVQAPPRRLFRLNEPAPSQYVPERPIEQPYIPRVWGVPGPAPAPATVKAQVPARPARRRTQARPARSASLTVSAPLPARKGRRVLSFTAATDRSVEAMMGSLRLECGPENIDLERLTLGVLSLAVDHVSSLLIGRILSATIGGGRLDMEAEISDSSYARRILAEIDDGLRIGFSPGFQITEAEPLSESDRDYDPDAFIQVSATRWLPFECSSTPIPRNPLALIKGEASIMSMNGKALDMRTIAPPNLVSIDDPVGLGIAACRMALQSGKGSPRQRENLSTMLDAYDAAIAKGEAPEVAATLAKQAAGF